MVYQLEVLYGASIKDKVYYSTATVFNNCTKLLNEFPNEDIFKEPVNKKIKEDGLNPDDFTFSYLTKEQYENRNKPEESSTIEIKR